MKLVRIQSMQCNQPKLKAREAIDEVARAKKEQLIESGSTEEKLQKRK